MNNNQEIIVENTDLNEVRGQIGNLQINWIMQKDLVEQLGFKLKINSNEMFIYRYFYHIFGIMPKMLFMDDQILIFFLNKTDKQLLDGPKINEVNKLRLRFKRNIYFVVNPFKLQDLIYNLFSRIHIYKVICTLSENENKNKFNNSNDEINLNLIGKKSSPVSIYVYIDEKDMSIALGKKGSFIHCINKFLNIKLGNYRIYLRSKLEI